MRLITISKIFLILALPLLIFLLIVNFIGFDELFYREKFAEYKVQEEIPQAVPMHEKVINFITGKNNELPDEFNGREKQHLFDVKNLVNTSTLILYSLIALFILLLIVSMIMLKVNSYIIDFVGKVLLYGGLLTVGLAAALLFFTNSNFSSVFDSFHRIFFKSGTYSFEPAKESIVRLYPEQLFMDLGIKISVWVAVISIIIILSGLILIIKTKRKKIQLSKS